MTTEKKWKELSEIGKKLHEKSKSKRLPGELTVTEFARENGIGREVARSILKGLLEANLISVRIVGMYKFYSPKNPKT